MNTPAPNTLRLGCHLSSANGCLSTAQEAASIGANTFQTFTRNPRGGAVKPLAEMQFEAYLASNLNVAPILFHAPYTLNFAAAKPEVLSFARQTLTDDLLRLQHCPGQLYNFHPGSHVGQGPETGIRLIAEALNTCVPPNCATTLLLETMAGKGSEVGRSFEELRAIIDATHPDLAPHIGVCLDTCHVWDAGYDIVQHLDDVLADFDRILGLHRLRAIHLNDSMNPLGAHKDRHAKIGEGYIGLDPLLAILRHPLLQHLPFELETPNDTPGYAREIALLRSHL